MAIVNSTGILTVTSIPTHTPTASQARLARLQDTLTFFYYNGTAWVTCRLNTKETYNGAIIPDNADVGTALQALEDAIEAITLDGNHTPIVRANAIEDVEPTSTEVPNPVSGDTADINLTSGKVEKWVYTGGAWSKSFTIDYNDVTDLSWVSGASSGQVASSTGSSAVVPAVTNTEAGLALPAHKIKADFISVTQPVDLDAIESSLATAIQTVSDTNSILMTKSGTSIFADLQLSVTQGTDMSVTIEADGLRVAYSESSPTSYISRDAAVAAIGLGKEIQIYKSKSRWGYRSICRMDIKI